MTPTLWLLATARTQRRAGLLGWTTGVLMTLGGFYWFAPLMHQHAKLPWPLAILCLVALAAWQGLSLLLAARAIWWIRAWKKLPMAVVAPVAIVALEHVWPVIFPYQLAITQAPASGPARPITMPPISFLSIGTWAACRAWPVEVATSVATTPVISHRLGILCMIAPPSPTRPIRSPAAR